MITVLGLPRGPLTDAELAALATAHVVAGGARHLAAISHLLPPAARQVELGANLDADLDLVAANQPSVVLASGDPGFFGVLRALAERVPAADLDVRPAPSSIARAFALAGLPWDDARVATAHGRDPRTAVNLCRRFPKVAVLTEPHFGPAALARALRGLDRQLVVAEHLGDPGQRVTRGDPGTIAAGDFADPNVVLVLDPAAQPGAKGTLAPPRAAARRWGLPDDAFDHRGGMITKAEVRAHCLALLGPGEGDLAWDVGAGSGAVGIECARLGAAVIAVEADPPSVERIQRNAATHRVPIEVVTGHAPQALEALPDPDAVFVGGGGTAVAAACAARTRRAVVAALATVERTGPVLAAFDAEGLESHATLLQAARLAPLPGGGHRLDATNPVFVVAGHRAVT